MFAGLSFILYTWLCKGIGHQKHILLRRVTRVGEITSSVGVCHLVFSSSSLEGVKLYRRGGFG